MSVGEDENSQTKLENRGTTPNFFILKYKRALKQSDKCQKNLIVG